MRTCKKELDGDCPDCETGIIVSMVSGETVYCSCAKGKAKYNEERGTK